MLKRADQTQETFEQWYEREAGPLTERICAGVGSRVEGREFAAEAMARAFERWGRVSRMERPEGWIYKTAINLHRRSWSRRAIERRAIDKLAPIDLVDSIDPFEEDVVVEGVRPDDLESALHGLPPRMKAAIELRYWDGLSESEVAKEMSIAPGTASALLTQARQRMRAGVADQREDYT